MFALWKVFGAFRDRNENLTDEVREAEGGKRRRGGANGGRGEL